jgi:hypothetical protein
VLTRFGAQIARRRRLTAESSINGFERRPAYRNSSSD